MEIEELLERTMTVGQLRHSLSFFGDDDKVVITSSYGDRGQTEQALPIDDNDITQLECDQRLATTGYSHSGVCVRTLEENTEEGPRNVVLIRT